MKKPKIGSIGHAFYIIACIFSFGAVWICKLIIQKAIVDAFK